MKRFVALLIVVIILVQPIVYADVRVEDSGIGNYADFNEHDILDFEETEVDFPERMASSLIMALPNFLIKALGLQDLIPLVYMKNPPPSQNSPGNAGGYYWGPIDTKPKKQVAMAVDLVKGVWLADEYAMLKEVQEKIKSEFASLIFIAIAVTGFIMVFRSSSSESVNHLKSLGAGMVILIIMIKFLPNLLDIAYSFNKWCVNFAWSLLSPNER